MIALIAGWHFVALGIVTIFLACIVHVVSTAICGVIAIVIGLPLSLIFRNACSSWRSDKPQPDDPTRQLDIY